MRRATCLYCPFIRAFELGPCLAGSIPGPLDDCLPRYPLPGVPANGFCKDSAHANAKERPEFEGACGDFLCYRLDKVSSWAPCPEEPTCIRRQDEERDQAANGGGRLILSAPVTGDENRKPRLEAK